MVILVIYGTDDTNHLCQVLKYCQGWEKPWLSLASLGYEEDPNPNPSSNSSDSRDSREPYL